VLDKTRPYKAVSKSQTKTKITALVKNSDSGDQANVGHKQTASVKEAVTCIPGKMLLGAAAAEYRQAG